MADKLAKRRIVPKPRPLHSDPFERIFAPVAMHPPHLITDETDPDIVAAQDTLRQAQEALTRTIREKARLSLVKAGLSLDPADIQQLCRKEPWKKGKLTDLSVDYFGFVPEKFEAMATLYDKGTQEHTQYIDAMMQARLIYWDQLKIDVNVACFHLCEPGQPVSELRLKYEELSSLLWNFYNSAKLENHPVFKNQGGRILWAAHAVGRHYEDRWKCDRSHKRFHGSI